MAQGIPLNSTTHERGQPSNNKNMKKEIRKTVKQSLVMENSFGIVRRQDDVEVEFIVRLPSNHYGSFEILDKDTGGEDWYAEGGLWFKGNELTDYDGVFCLSDVIMDILEDNGFDVEDMKQLIK